MNSTKFSNNVSSNISSFYETTALTRQEDENLIAISCDHFCELNQDAAVTRGAFFRYYREDIDLELKKYQSTLSWANYFYDQELKSLLKYRNALVLCCWTIFMILSVWIASDNHFYGLIYDSFIIYPLEALSWITECIFQVRCMAYISEILGNAKMRSYIMLPISKVVINIWYVVLGYLFTVRWCKALEAHAVAWSRPVFDIIFKYRSIIKVHRSRMPFLDVPSLHVVTGSCVIEKMKIELDENEVVKTIMAKELLEDVDLIEYCTIMLKDKNSRTKAVLVDVATKWLISSTNCPPQLRHHVALTSAMLCQTQSQAENVYTRECGIEGIVHDH